MPAMGRSGLLRLEREMTVLWGVMNLRWKSRKAWLVSSCPEPLLGMPMPLPPKAVILTSSFMSSTSASVWKVCWVRAGYFEELLFAEGQVEQQVDHDVDVLLEEGALEVGALDVVVEVHSRPGQRQELAA